MLKSYYGELGSLCNFKGTTIVEMLYKKLWKVLIDRDMTQTDLRKSAGISSSTLALMNKNLPVTTAVVEKICKALQCQPNDIFSTKALRSLKTRKVSEYKKQTVTGEIV